MTAYDNGAVDAQADGEDGTIPVCHGRPYLAKRLSPTEQV
ncbi:hypothetical protein SLEP1_g593 [Rubroshorea leprosula]|uniref:Uncharacterized protein n=1 Tax=Rubroshorea leprosula TaxID=152421 RepID=A0AAV5HLF5_9ROSI|nr:hypothetical protein SLEP1_g593 [Rubroshorea leprosula]